MNRGTEKLQQSMNIPVVKYILEILLVKMDITKECNAGQSKPMEQVKAQNLSLGGPESQNI